ncbi:MAG: HAD family hydrolase [Chloroflexota bacterium]
MSRPRPTTVVFDLGAVLIDWDPRHLFREHFPDDPAGMERFLAEVCTPAWNHRQDEGRTWAEAVAELVGRHPHEEARIRAYADRWPEMLGGPIAGTVAILERLDAAGIPCYALTNWSAETFPIARARYGFLGRFRGIVVSGDERVAKPDPAIYRILLERHALAPETAVFIDDRAENVAAARALGMDGILFTDPAALADALRSRGLPA